MGAGVLSGCGRGQWVRECSVGVGAGGGSQGSRTHWSIIGLEYRHSLVRGRAGIWGVERQGVLQFAGSVFLDRRCVAHYRHLDLLNQNQIFHQFKLLPVSVPVSVPVAAVAACECGSECVAAVTATVNVWV